MSYHTIGIAGFSFVIAALGLLLYLPAQFETERMIAAMMGGTGIFFAVMYILTTGRD